MALRHVIRRCILNQPVRQMVHIVRHCGKTSIHVFPNDALIDQELSIKINGLLSEQKVTLHSSVTENGAKFGAYGCYVADSSGHVDVQKDTCISGTYQGVDSMGLFWSVIQAPRQKIALRLFKKDVTSPMTFKLSVYDGHKDWNSLYNDAEGLKLITSTEIRRWYKAHNVTRHAVKTGSIRGSVFIPPGPGPFPGVIDMFGGAGGLIDFRAGLLASKGFVVLALAYFAYDDLTKRLVSQFSVDYFKEATDWLLEQPYVKGSQIAVNCVCKGSEMGLALTTYCSKVKALVIINPVPFVLNYPMKHGDDLINTPENGGYALDKLYFSSEGVITKRAFHAEANYMFEIYKTDARVLCIVGEDDQCVSPELSHTLYGLYPEDKKSNFELVSYPGAGHLIEPPYAPLCRASYMSTFGVSLVWGGKPKEHAYSQLDSWKRTVKLLKENMKEEDEIV